MKSTGPKARIMRAKISPDRKVVIPKAVPFPWNDKPYVDGRPQRTADPDAKRK
jgi:hypothetical protein